MARPVLVLLFLCALMCLMPGKTLADDILSYGMTPIYGTDIHDGTYDIDADSSSMFFKLRDVSLTAAGGQLQATFSIYSLSYLYIYPGTAQEAQAAKEADWIRRDETAEEEKRSVFTLPVSALNREIDCAAYSIEREQWYDRKLVFDAGSLPAQAADFPLPDYTLIRRAVRYYVAQGKAEDPMEKEEQELSFDEGERESALQVLCIAAVIIAVGGLINYLLKRRMRV